MVHSCFTKTRDETQTNIKLLTTIPPTTLIIRVGHFEKREALRARYKKKAVGAA
jgi:hypothetical protein